MLVTSAKGIVRAEAAYMSTPLPEALPSQGKRAERRYRTWVKARRAQRAHLQVVHPDSIPECVCERSVWYFATRKRVGHHHHCEMCHPRYRHGVRSHVKWFMAASGLVPSNKQVKAFSA